MKTRPVLAKKGYNDHPEGNVTLWQHTKDVWDASRALFGKDEPTRLCRQWFRFFKVPMEHYDTFRRRLDLAALWHDTGKATCSFQNMLLEGEAQLVRHEYLSYELFSQVEKSLGLGEDDRYAIRFAVLGHHLKAGSRYLFGGGTGVGLERKDLPIRVFHDDDGIQQICWETERLRGLATGSLEVAADIEGAKATSAVVWARRIRDGEEDWLDEEAEPSAEFRALALALVASDSAGSGLRRTGQSVTEWIEARFPEKGLFPGDLRETIIEGRISDIRRGAESGCYQPNDLQKAAVELGPRAVIVSPCGSGKTLAAWLWAEKQLESVSASRVLFLYPTRNTATEGFRDYVSWGKEDASLLHGTSDYDLEGMAFQGADHPGEEKRRDERHVTDYRPDAALYSLGYWNKRYVSATVDSFLSFSANNYGADCLLPLLCDSLVIVDEVHSFDPQMFNHLVRLLEQCDVPVLMMTATLPQLMRDELEKQGARVMEAPDPEKKTQRARYDIRFAHEEETMEQAIREWIEDGKEQRLLAVSNVVSRCQALGEALIPLVEERDDIEMLVYHSRFRLKDRKRIHEEVIDKFRNSGKRLVLLSTQVCQMSLDLDANSLYSEVAPLPDLIQRMGRANRKGSFERGNIRFFPVPPKKHKPYTEEALREARERLEKLPDLSAVSQAELGELMASLMGREMQDPDLVPLFSSLPGLESADYRLADEWTVDSVLPSDLEHYIELRKARDPQAVGLVVPVPFYQTEKPKRSDAPRFLRVAKEDSYSAFLGFVERKKNEQA